MTTFLIARFFRLAQQKVALFGLIFTLLTLFHPALSAAPVGKLLNWTPLKIKQKAESLQSNRAAHWVAPNLLLLAPSALPTQGKQAQSSPTYFLVKSANSQFSINNVLANLQENRLQGVQLFPQNMPEWVRTRYPHLHHFSAFRLTGDTQQTLNQRAFPAIKQALKQDLALLTLNKKTLIGWSKLQTYGVLDDLYTKGPHDADEYPYGAIISGNSTLFRLWAPTAVQVNLKLYSDQKQTLKRLAMREDTTSGAWYVEVPNNLHGRFYRYEITLFHYESERFESLEVTDPYSLSLSENSLYSQAVDLQQPDTMPKNWQSHTIPTLERPEQHIIYEMHVRDFSLNYQLPEQSPPAGKYSAFSNTTSPQVTHLQQLREAGLNTLHLLPVYDIATVNENPGKVVTLQHTVAQLCELDSAHYLCANNGQFKQQTLLTLLKSYDPLSDNAQKLINSIRYMDGYNWGYDPLHYTVPEGSYALNPEGFARIKAFRTMVKRIHDMGFRLIMDVVYNHTFAAGLHRQSVLDKIVPLYYHRLHPETGAIEQSTCCENTATEHRMMEKLMSDSLVVWAEQYKIDGFRFDLMGHQPKAAMLAAREKVRAIDPDTYFYGEGWNFGEVANNAQFEQAAQLPLAGSEIGTFSDRLRDAVRGGSSFVSGEALRMGQGLGNGLVTLPNELSNKQDLSLEFTLSVAQAKVGLAGNLANIPLQYNGQPATGKTVPYGDGPTGYALDPADTINYVSKHDNQTLWDNNQYRIAFEASPETRADMQILSLAYPLLSQGIPFIHMGSELLRSKGFLRDSFDFNEWFNQVDFTKTHNNYHAGLPPAEKDQANWAIINRIKTGNDGRDNVSKTHIERAEKQFLALLKIRSGSPLFSLATEKNIVQRMQFHDLGEEQGVIAFSLNDDATFVKARQLNNIDPDSSGLLVVFNNGSNAQTLNVRVNTQGIGWLNQLSQASLHPAIKATKLKKWQASSPASDGTLHVPAFSVGVWVAPQR